MLVGQLSTQSTSLDLHINADTTGQPIYGFYIGTRGHQSGSFTRNRNTSTSTIGIEIPLDTRQKFVDIRLTASQLSDEEYDRDVKGAINKRFNAMKQLKAGDASPNGTSRNDTAPTCNSRID